MPNASSNPDVVVVGGGVMGLSTAMWASQGGAAVTIIEASHVASESSGASAGIVGTHYSLPSDVAVRKESLDFLGALGDEVALTRTGVLRVGTSSAEMEAYATSLAVQHAIGVRAELLDREHVRRLVPEMAVDDLAGGIWMPDSGHVDGHLLCNAYLERAQAAGARLLTRTRLANATRRPEGWELETTAGVLRSDVVVNAAGARSETVGQLLGHAVGIVPQRHEMVIARLRKPREPLMPNVGFYFAGPNGVTGDGLYWRAERPEQLLVGVHAGFDPEGGGEDPDNWTRAVGDAIIESLAEKLYRRLPGLADMGLAKGWAGLYPMTRDDQPSLGRGKRSRH